MTVTFVAAGHCTPVPQKWPSCIPLIVIVAEQMGMGPESFSAQYRMHCLLSDISQRRDVCVVFLHCSLICTQQLSDVDWLSLIYMFRDLTNILLSRSLYFVRLTCVYLLKMIYSSIFCPKYRILRFCFWSRILQFCLFSPKMILSGPCRYYMFCELYRYTDKPTFGCWSIILSLMHSDAWAFSLWWWTLITVLSGYLH